MIGIVDYDAGNTRSVILALRSLKLEYRLSKKPADLENADRIICPGVGEARYAMEQLARTGFDRFLHEYAGSGRPLLGICLGSQIVFEHSDESNTACLGLLPGNIRHFSALFAQTAAEKGAAETPLKIPHMGWNDIYYPGEKNGGSLFAGIPEHSDFYFVHSYVIQPEDFSVVSASTDYGISVPAAIHKDNIYALQFHPEKSGTKGLTILKNFAELPSC